MGQHIILRGRCSGSINSGTSELSNSTPQSQPINNIGELIRQYPQQFDQIGELPTAHTLVVDPNVPPRRTPIALKDKIKAELDKMVEQQVTRRIEEPTEWVTWRASRRKMAASACALTSDILTERLSVRTTRCRHWKTWTTHLPAPNCYRSSMPKRVTGQSNNRTKLAKIWPHSKHHSVDTVSVDSPSASVWDKIFFSLRWTAYWRSAMGHAESWTISLCTEHLSWSMTTTWGSSWTLQNNMDSYSTQLNARSRLNKSSYLGSCTPV